MAIEWQRWYRLLLFSMVYIAVMMFLTLSLTMIIGFGYLGFRDPRDTDVTCYANSTFDLPFPTNATDHPGFMESHNVINVTERFEILLQVGFYLFIVYTLIWILYYMPCI